MNLKHQTTYYINYNHFDIAIYVFKAFLKITKIQPIFSILTKFYNRNWPPYKWSFIKG